MTTPAGSISLAQENLRVMLADCAAFRTWCGAATQAEALARIHHDGLPRPANGEAYELDELTGYRPFALVYTSETDGVTKTLDAIGEGYEFASAGRLKLRLSANAAEVVADEPTGSAILEFKNAVGQILDGLCGMAGKAPYLAFHQIRLDEGPFGPHPSMVADQGVWLGAEISLAWRGL